jgi:hypothetical protein
MAFTIPSYRLGEQQPRGAAPYLQVDAPAGAFGATGAQHLQESGRHLERAADGVWKLATAEGAAEERAIANETRVEQLLNGFIAARHPPPRRRTVARMAARHR